MTWFSFRRPACADAHPSTRGSRFGHEPGVDALRCRLADGGVDCFRQASARISLAFPNGISVSPFSRRFFCPRLNRLQHRAWWMYSVDAMKSRCTRDKMISG